MLVLPVLEWQWFGVLEGLAVTELLDPARHVEVFRIGRCGSPRSLICSPCGYPGWYLRSLLAVRLLLTVVVGSQQRVVQLLVVVL